MKGHNENREEEKCGLNRRGWGGFEVFVALWVDEQVFVALWVGEQNATKRQKNLEIQLKRFVVKVEQHFCTWCECLSAIIDEFDVD